MTFLERRASRFAPLTVRYRRVLVFLAPLAALIEAVLPFGGVRFAVPARREGRLRARCGGGGGLIRAFRNPFTVSEGMDRTAAWYGAAASSR